MSTKETMINDLLKKIKGYFMQLNLIKDLMDVDGDIDHYSSKFERSPNFLLITQCALAETYCLGFMRLYDNSNKTRNIPNLIDECIKNIDLFSNKTETENKLKEFQQKIHNDYKKTLCTLKYRRDKLYAHNDPKYFGEKLTNLPSDLPLSELILLEIDTRNILRYLFKQLSNEEPIQTRYNKDLQNLFINDKIISFEPQRLEMEQCLKKILSNYKSILEKNVIVIDTNPLMFSIFPVIVMEDLNTKNIYQKGIAIIQKILNSNMPYHVKSYKIVIRDKNYSICECIGYTPENNEYYYIKQDGEHIPIK